MVIDNVEIASYYDVIMVCYQSFLLKDGLEQPLITIKSILPIFKTAFNYILFLCFLYL